MQRQGGVRRRDRPASQTFLGSEHRDPADDRGGARIHAPRSHAVGGRVRADAARCPAAGALLRAHLGRRRSPDDAPPDARRVRQGPREDARLRDQQKPIAFCMEEVTAKAYADPLRTRESPRPVPRRGAERATARAPRPLRPGRGRAPKGPTASWCAEPRARAPGSGRAPTLERFAAAVIESLASGLPRESRAATVAGGADILGEGYPPDAPHLRQPGQPGGPPKTLVSRARARLARMFGSSPLLSRRRGPPLTG